MISFRAILHLYHFPNCLLDTNISK